MRQQGITGILVLIVALLGATLFLPFPYYQNNDVYCESYPPQLCAKKGWHLRKSLWKQILKTEEQIDSSPISTQQPTPDPTANWKVYTNTKFKYMFKYPPNTAVYSRVESLPGNEKERDITTTCCVVVIEEDKTVLGNEVFEDGKSIEEHKRRLSEDPAVSGMEETTFAGERALIYMYTSVKTLTVVHKSISYNFLFVTGEEDLGDRILSTFKFTSQ